MTLRQSRFLLLAVLALPLGGCFSFTTERQAPQPAPVVVQPPPPPSGSVVVQPNQ